MRASIVLALIAIVACVQARPGLLGDSSNSATGSILGLNALNNNGVAVLGSADGGGNTNKCCCDDDKKCCCDDKKKKCCCDDKKQKCCCDDKKKKCCCDDGGSNGDSSNSGNGGLIGANLLNNNAVGVLGKATGGGNTNKGCCDKGTPPPKPCCKKN